MSIVLRPRQLKMIEQAREKLREKVTRLLLQAPCGFGKTILGAFITHSSASKQKRVMFLTHRSELMNQASRTMKSFGIEHGFISANYTPKPYALVQIAMVDTLRNRISKIQRPDILLVDECLRGDSIIDTDVGKIRIDQVKELNAKYVLSYDGYKACMKRIKNFFPMGFKKTLEIKFNSGSISCTEDHLFFTDSGWIKACQLTSKSKILVSADAVNFALTQKEGIDHMSRVTGFGKKNILTGMKDLIYLLKMRLFANADVAKKYLLDLKMQLLLKKFGQHRQNIRHSQKGIIGARLDGSYLYRKLRDKQYLEHYLGTVQYYFHTPDHCRQEFAQTMGRINRGGQNIKLNSLKVLIAKLKWLKIRAMGKFQLKQHLHAFQHLMKFTKQLFLTEKKQSQKSGWIKLAILDLLGGIAMMVHLIAVEIKDMRYFILKDFHLMNVGLLHHGLKINLVMQKFKNLQNTTLLDCLRDLVKKCLGISRDMSRKNLTTKWENIVGIKDSLDCEVFDIEVEDTHCFFANNILVHNCHHATSSTWAKIINYYHSMGTIIIGLSATPQRLDGKPLSDMFDDMVMGPSVKDLISEGNLADYSYYAPPQIADLEGLKSKFGDFDTKEQALRIDTPVVFGDAIQHYKKIMHGKRAIAFHPNIKSSEHFAAQCIAEGIPCLHVDGEMTTSERAHAIKCFEDGSVWILSNVSLFGEGFDVSACDGVILLRRTSALSLFIQMCGRAMRPHASKEKAIILDHVGNINLHGLPDKDHEWSLDGRKKKSKKKDVESVPVRQCPKCYHVFEPVKICPQCGFDMGVVPKEMQQVDGELKEVERQMEIALNVEKKKEVGKARTLQDLEKIARERKYKDGWAKAVFTSRAKRA